MKTILYLFAAFVIVNLVVGLYYSRGVKTFKGYAVGDGNMHPWLLAATIAATWITGSGFASYLTRGFNDGLYQMGVPIFASFSLLLLGFFALRMGEFLGTTSVASAMERLYGKRVMWLTAIAAIICCVFHLAGQLRVFSNVVANVLGLDPTTMLLTLSTLVVLYSIFGGIRAVVFTDLLQFGMMGLGLPVLIYLIYGYLGEQVFTISYVPDNKTFVTNNVLKGPRGLFLQTIGYMRKLLIVFMPPLFQRCLVNRDLLKTRKAFRRATLAWVYISILVMLLGRMLATDPIGLDRKNLLESIVGKYPYVGLKTALAFVIMAMALSSADSNINSSAVLLCDLTQHKSLSHVRGFGVLTGLISLAMVFFTQEKSLLQVVYLGDFLYSAIVVPVLILALLGFRSSNRVALISMIGSALVALGCKLIYTDSLIGIVLGALTNVVLMFALHYGLGEFGGWVGIKDRIPLIAHRQLCQRKWARRWAATRSFDLGRYLQSNLPKKEGHYIFFGLYVMTFVFGGAFFLPREVMQDGRLIWLLGSFLFLNSLMMTYPIWPEEIKGRRAIAPLWAFGVGYILFYIGGLLLLLGGFHPAHMMLFAANLTLGMLLLRRKLLGLWMVVGGVMAVVTCRGMGHEIGFSDVETTWAQLLFSLLVTLAGFWAIYANKQRHRKLARKHVSLDSLQQSTEDALVALRMAPEHFAQKLVETQHAGVESAYQMSKERLGEANELTKKIDWSAQYLAKTLHMIQQQTQVRPVTTSLITFLQDLYTQHPALNEAGLILYNHARTKQVKWDLEKVHQLIYKIYRYLKPHYPKTPYGYLHVEDTSLQYPGKKEASPAVAMVLTFHAEKPKVAASYTYVERQVAPYLLGNRQLREVQNLTDKHYGHLDLLQSQALIVLPADLSKIRPKVVEDQPAPDQAPSGELLREAKRAEINFWVQMVGKDHYNLAEIERAVYFMKAAHQHQTRQNKAPYYTHTLTVAKYASQHDDRPHVLMAALLHDVVEDTHVTLEEVSIRFGHQVAELVKLLSNTQLDTFRKYKDSDKQAHIDRMTQNRAALLIKACDCLHNLETLAHMPLQKQRAKAQETLDYYVPVLRAAGFTQLANQLEKLALRFL